MPALEKRPQGNAAPHAQRYRLPSPPKSVSLPDIVKASGRSFMESTQTELLRDFGTREASVYYVGNLSFLDHPTVSVVGTRDATDEGRKRATRLARELAAAGYVVMSGLARGIDAAAHRGTVAAGGKTIGVIGTPLDKASPAENADLQETIAAEHLLISPFAVGAPVFRSNFPIRNRVMALLSDATVIVDASDTSGTLHQAAECLRQGRWLFILKSVYDNPAVSWPQRFIGDKRTVILSSMDDLFERLPSK